MRPARSAEILPCNVAFGSLATETVKADFAPKATKLVRRVEAAVSIYHSRDIYSACRLWITCGRRHRKSLSALA